jgi:hypothetical protein
MHFQWVEGLARVQGKGARLPILRGINGFLSTSQTRNKSGALLLTNLDLTMRRGDEPFTKRRRAKRRLEQLIRGKFAGALVATGLRTCLGLY